MALRTFRITKYDPAFRDERGTYRRDEWTSRSQVGQVFEGAPFTEADYLRVESAYVTVAVAFLEESGVTALSVRGLENPGRRPLSFGEGSEMTSKEAGEALRRILREEFWCRLEAPDAFLRVDWDFYLYMGVARPCPAAQALARGLGLFLEPCPEPT